MKRSLGVGGGCGCEVEDGEEEDAEDEEEEEEDDDEYDADAGSSGYIDEESSIAIFWKSSPREMGGLDGAPIMASAAGSTA